MIFLKLELFRDRDLLQESFIVIDVSIDKLHAPMCAARALASGTKSILPRSFIQFLPLQFFGAAFA
jgi:hypothetical protein